MENVPAVNTYPQLADQAVANLQADFVANLAWLNKVFPLVHPAQDSNEQIFPSVYNNDGTIKNIDIRPDKSVESYAFFELNSSPVIDFENFQATYNLGIVVWLDLRTCISSKSYDYTHELIQDVLARVNKQDVLGSPTYSIQPEEIFKNYQGLQQRDKQFLMRPFSAFRIDFEMRSNWTGGNCNVSTPTYVSDVTNSDDTYSESLTPGQDLAIPDITLTDYAEENTLTYPAAIDITVPSDFNNSGGSVLSVDFTISEDEPSTGEEVTYTATGDAGDSYFWKFGAEDWIEGTAVQAHTFTTAGTFDVWLRVVTLDINGEADAVGDELKEDSVVVTVGWNLNTYLRSDGTNDYLSMTAKSNNEQTILLRFKCRGNDSSYGYLFSNTTTGANREGLAIDEGAGGVYGRIYYYDGAAITTMHTLSTPSDLNQIVFTRNFTTKAVQLFVNGSLEYSGTIAAISTNSIDLIGTLSGTANYSYWDLYEVAIWDAKTANLTEAQNMYNSGTMVDPSTIIASPARHYQFIGTGSTVIDYGSDGEDTTLNNYSIPGAWGTV